MIKKILIYEDWDHWTPVGKGWQRGLQMNNVISMWAPHKISLNQLDEQFDVLIYFDVRTDNIGIEMLKTYKQNNPHTLIVGIGLLPKPEYVEYKGIIDFWCTTCYSYPTSTLLFNKMGFNVYHIPLATFKEVPDFYDTHFTYDLSFIGQFGNKGHGNRNEDKYLYPLLLDDNLKCFTAGFEYNIYKMKYADFSTTCTIYGNTKINLNFHYDHQKTNDRVDLNSRVFDIAMCSGFQMCDHPLVINLFDNSIPVINSSEWIDKFYEFLSNESYREKCAIKSNKIVSSNHCWQNRMYDFLQILKEYE